MTFEITANSFNWIGEAEEQDKCLHGRIKVQINDTIVGNETNGWTLSASALYFLRTLDKDHDSQREEHMIPCCGFNMLPNQNELGDKVLIMGCPNGIDWDITHRGSEVVHEGQDFEEVVSFEAYRHAVLAFAEQVEEFYKSSKPKFFFDEEDRLGYEGFWEEWYERVSKHRAMK